MNASGAEEEVSPLQEKTPFNTAFQKAMQGMRGEKGEQMEINKQWGRNKGRKGRQRSLKRRKTERDERKKARQTDLL